MYEALSTLPSFVLDMNDNNKTSSTSKLFEYTHCSHSLPGLQDPQKPNFLHLLALHVIMYLRAYCWGFQSAYYFVEPSTVLQGLTTEFGTSTRDVV